jgi:uncharacterized repeat protein (TIGR01451 family)
MYSEPDLAKGRVFTLGSHPVVGQPDAWTLYAFDSASLQQVGSMALPGVMDCSGNLIRWGSNGLACAGTDVFGNLRNVWLIRTSLVPAGSQAADLAITMSDAPHPATLGGVLTYQIQVINNGPSDAQAAVFQDVLPAGVTFLSATSSLGACNWSNGVVTCAFGTLSNGIGAAVTVSVTPNIIGPLTNLAVLSALSFDPNSANNSAVTITPSQHSPFVQTQQPWRQSQISETLNGVVLPNSLPSTAWFEWGLRGIYDHATAPATIGAGGAVIRISSALTGLVPGTVYQCRLVASNGAGVAYGQMIHFTTGHKISGWGDNASGQTSIPPGLSNVVALAAGRYHDLCLRSDGTVVAWGGDSYGQTNVPAGLANVVAVAAGDALSVALRADGTVAAWGQSYVGATNVPGGLNGVVSVAAGSGGILALKSNGTLVAWGNWSGPSAGLSNVVAIAAGYTHYLAVKAGGTVASWGDNGSGQTNVPTGLSGVVAVAGGYAHSLALRADGTVAAWGENTNGQCDVPGDLTNAVAVAAGYRHSLALKRDGTVVAWGLGSSGQTVVPSGVHDVSLIAGGVTHSLADGGNLPPRSISNTVSGLANHDLVISLAGKDPNGDVLSYRVSALPPAGTLYQYSNGTRGAAIRDTVSAVADQSGRLVFAPAMNAYGSPYTSLSFVANDGETDSSPAAVVVSISPPTNPTFTSFGFGTNGSYALAFNGDSNTTYCVWASTNFLTWEYLGTAARAGSGAFSFSDASANAFPRRFYRISTGCLAPAAQYFGFSRSADGSFEVRFAGSQHSAYRIWASTNLTDWQVLGIATEAEAGSYRFLDISAAKLPQRFYRAGTP